MGAQKHLKVAETKQQECKISQVLSISVTKFIKPRWEAQHDTTLQKAWESNSRWLGKRKKKSHSTSKNTYKAIYTHTGAYWDDEDENATYKEFLHKADHAIIVHSRRAETFGIIHGAHLGTEKARKQPKVLHFRQAQWCYRRSRVKSKFYYKVKG